MDFTFRTNKILFDRAFKKESYDKEEILDLVLVQHIKQLWRNNNEKICILPFFFLVFIAQEQKKKKKIQVL